MNLRKVELEGGPYDGSASFSAGDRCLFGGELYAGDYEGTVFRHVPKEEEEKVEEAEEVAEPS